MPALLHRLSLPSCLLCLLALVGCSASDAMGAGRDMGTGAGSPDSVSEGDAGTPSEPGSPGEDTPRAEACRHLDLVFSVDPSGSMTEELGFLRDEIFPELARTLQAMPGIEDFRVSVMDSCWSPASFHTRGRGGECGFSSGQPWIDSGAPDVLGEFACVGDLHGEGDPGYGEVSSCTGSDSDNEHPATAAMFALEAAAAGTENAGFIRDDALLVVFALTDEDEQPSNGPGPLSAEEIHHRIVAVKGNPRAVAFLGVGGATECEGVYGSAEEASLLKDVTARFADWDRGLFWDLCGGNLNDGLARVVELIEEACTELEEPCNEFDPDVDWTECYPAPDDPDDPGSDDPPLI